MTAPVLAPRLQASGPVVSAPIPGEVLQGAVTITGSSEVPGFVSAELAFAYSDDATGTWFPIATLTQPVTFGPLAVWDTTGISDGNYTLRLRVQLADGTHLETLVQGLRVRNYSPIETPTPLPVAPQATSTNTPEPTYTPYPTPTSLPRNPAVVAPADLSSSIIYGGTATCVLFAIIGIYLWLRRKFK